MNRLDFALMLLLFVVGALWQRDHRRWLVARLMRLDHRGRIVIRADATDPDLAQAMETLQALRAGKLSPDALLPSRKRLAS